jgi:hypothetical protein
MFGTVRPWNTPELCIREVQLTLKWQIWDNFSTYETDDIYNKTNTAYKVRLQSNKEELLALSCLSVYLCLSVCLHETIRLPLGRFSWYFILKYFQKSVEKIQVLLTLILLMWRIWWAPNNASKWQMGFNSTFKGLKSNKNNKYFTWRPTHIFLSNLTQCFSEWEIFQT